MSEKRTAANRRNAKLSTGPISTKGKRKSALNAVKHGLSIPTDRADDTVLALAALLSPTAASAHISALAVEAARRIVDFNRVKRAYLGTHTGKAAGLSQARERWRVYDVAREVQAAC